MVVINNYHIGHPRRFICRLQVRNEVTEKKQGKKFFNLPNFFFKLRVPNCGKGRKYINLKEELMVPLKQ